MDTRKLLEDKTREGSTERFVCVYIYVLSGQAYNHASRLIDKQANKTNVSNNTISSLMYSQSAYC